MAKLGDFYKITSGGTPSRSHEEYYENGSVSWVKTGDLKSKYLSQTEEKISELGLESSSARIYPQNTVLLAMYGATIGAASILKIEAATNQACAAFVPREDILPEYLYAFLESRKERFTKDAVGGAQPNLSASYLKNVKFNHPTLEIQRGITNILNKTDDLIFLRKQQLAKLDELIKARFVEMFGYPGHGRKEWPQCSLGNVCELNPKKGKESKLKSDLQISFVPMPAVSENGTLDASVTKTYGEVKTGFTYFAENDVLFAKITPCMENGKGAVATNLKNEIGFGSTEFHVLRPIKGKTDPYWIYELTSFEQFRQTAAKNMTGSAGQRRVPTSFLENYKISLPPIELQNQFATFVGRVNQQKQVVQQSLDKLELLKKALMQEYFG